MAAMGINNPPNVCMPLYYTYTSFNATKCMCKDPALITMLIFETARSVARIEGLDPQRRTAPILGCPCLDLERRSVLRPVVLLLFLNCPHLVCCQILQSLAPASSSCLEYQLAVPHPQTCHHPFPPPHCRPPQSSPLLVAVTAPARVDSHRGMLRIQPSPIISEDGCPKVNAPLVLLLLGNSPRRWVGSQQLERGSLAQIRLVVAGYLAGLQQVRLLVGVLVGRSWVGMARLAILDLFPSPCRSLLLEAT